MWFRVEDILIILSMYSMVWTKDLNFCEQFAKNNYSITYGYQHQMAGYYLFIDSYYLILKVDDNSKSVKFSSLETNKRNDRFGKEYKFAISSKVCDIVCVQSYWLTGVYDNKNKSVEWFELEANSLSEELILKNDSVLNVNLSRFGGFTPRLGFHTYSPHENVCFLQQRRLANSTQYRRDYQCVQFFGHSPHNVTDKVITDLKTQMDHIGYPPQDDYFILNDIKDNRRVIAIFESEEKYVFLHRENKSITYCFSSNKLFNKGCHKNVEILVDCSVPPTTPSTTSTTTTTWTTMTTTTTTTTANTTANTSISATEETSAETQSLPSVTQISSSESSPEQTTEQNEGLPIDERVTDDTTVSEHTDISTEFPTDEPKSGTSVLLWVFLVSIFIVIGVVLFLVFTFIGKRQKKTQNTEPKEVPKIVTKK